MKIRSITVIVLLLQTIVLTSCSKDELKPFMGDYTYNTSGTVVLNMSGIPLQVSLPNSTGQWILLILTKKTV